MNIQNNNNLCPNFSAKLYLSQLKQFNPSCNKQTYLDAMFNETASVRALDNFSVFIKNKLLCKYFTNPVSQLDKMLVKLQQKAVFYSRKLADKIFCFQNKEKISTLNKTFTPMTMGGRPYTEELANIGNTIDNKYLFINSEDKILDQVAKSKETSIFVLNHPNYHKDKFVYVIINSILSRLYLKENKTNFPVPRILVSKNMINIISKKVLNIYRKIGMVPIDASLQFRNKQYNAVSIKDMANEFVEDKNNIFFFPEGNNSSYVNMPIEQRMQSGITSFINTMLKKKKHVKIVPVGIDYSEKDANCLGRVFIGQPIRLSLSSDKAIYTQTNGMRGTINPSGNITDKNSLLTLLCNNIKSCMSKAKTID